MTFRVADDGMCYVCGKDNPEGFRLNFSHPEPGRLTAEVVFKKTQQGFKDVVHGGMLSILLDEMMVNLAWKEGTPAMTAELTVRFKKAAPVGQKVLLEGVLERGEGRILSMTASAKSPHGEVYATAFAKCLRVQMEPGQ